MLWAGWLAIPVTLYVDMFLHPAKWAAWKDHMNGISLWDMLRFRHIPDLRSWRMSDA